MTNESNETRIDDDTSASAESASPLLLSLSISRPLRQTHQQFAFERCAVVAGCGNGFQQQQLYTLKRTNTNVHSQMGVCVSVCVYIYIERVARARYVEMFVCVCARKSTTAVRTALSFERARSLLVKAKTYSTILLLYVCCVCGCIRL